MSKIGKLNLDLQEQANKLGFSTVQEALDNGYEVNVHGELVEPETVAHEAWLKEKKRVLEGLGAVLNEIEYMRMDEGDLDVDIIRAIKFIEGVKHE